MTGEEFEDQYQRMVDIYGERAAGHAREWQKIFGSIDSAEFEKQVDKVMREFCPFGQDKWPTPGEFDRIINGPWTQERRDREWAKNHDYAAFRASLRVNEQ